MSQEEEQVAFTIKISGNELEVSEDMTETDFFETVQTYMPEINRHWWVRLLRNYSTNPFKNKSMKPKWSTLMKHMKIMKNIDVDEICQELDETFSKENTDKNNETVYFDSNEKGFV